MSEKSGVSNDAPMTKIDAFTPPWPLWNDQVMNKLDWSDVPPGDVVVGKGGSRKASRKSMSRKSMAKKSITGGKKKSIKPGGSRKSVAGSRKSVAGGRKSVAGGRKSVSGGRQSTAGRKKSVSGGRKSAAGAGGRKSVAGGRKSVAGGRKSVAGGRKSVAGGRKSVAGGRKSVAGGRKSKVGGRKSISGRKPTGLKKSKSSTTHIAEGDEIALFNDPKGREIVPKSLPVHKWERPLQSNPDVTHALDAELGPLDLWTPNRHLVKSKVMRHIISSIMCLEVDGRNNPFVKELQTVGYVPNSGEFWNPRDHVYALTPVGDRTKHSPQFNPFGMYIIRLFYMGKWRRIVVDDYFPYDENGNLLLIRSRDNNNIWMQLLSKALLKVAALSWNPIDETLDFNPISLLTGWICNSVDVSLLMEEPIWKIIQGHCIVGKHPTERICASLDPKTCVHDAINVFLDKPKSRSVFIHFPEVKGGMDSIVVPCFEGLVYIKTAMNDLIPHCEPKWKNYRWVDWALERGLIRGKPGTTRRIVDLFVPLKMGSHTFVEESRGDQTDEAIEAATPSAYLSGYFKSDAYLYGKVFRYFKKLDIYYKRSYFEYEKNMDNIFVDLPKLDKQATDKAATEKQSTDKQATEKQTNPQTTVYRDHFFLGCDTPNCKNIFVTLTTLCEKTHSYGYLACEGYRWKNDSQGPIWFSMRTKGTRTHSINLGPGLQICRFWHNLPCINYISFHSRSQFYLTNKEEIINMQAAETASYMSYGAEMAEVFSKLIKAPLGSAAQGEYIIKYIGSFCPPHLRFQNLPTPADPEGHLNLDKLENLFEEKVVELIMENELDEDKCVTLFKGFQEFFLNPEFGQTALEKLKNPVGQNVLAKLTEINRQVLLELREAKKAWINSMDKVDEVKPPKSTAEGGKRRASARKSMRRKSAKGRRSSNRRQSKKSIRRKSSKKSIRRQSKKSIRRQSAAKKSIRRQSAAKKSIRRQSAKKSISSKKSIRRQSSRKSMKRRGSSKDKSGSKKVDKTATELKRSIYLLDSPNHNAVLLRKMLEYEDALLAAYPFRFDNDRKLQFCDYVGATEMNPPEYQDWAPIIIMTVSVPTEKPSPWGFCLFSESKRSQLNLYDLDNNMQIPFEYDPNNLVYLKENNNGYALVAYKTKDDKSVGGGVLNWRIRLYGEALACLPHPILSTQTISGLFFPNPTSKICTFLIKVTRNVTMCLVFSASKADIISLLTVTGSSDKQIIKLNGDGEIVVPPMVLNFSDSETQPAIEGIEEFNYFYGEVKAMHDSWPLKNRELLVLEDHIKWKEEELTEKISTANKPKDDRISRQSKESAFSVKENKSRKSSVKQGKLPTVDGGPRWTISLYTESHDSSGVKLVLDKRFEESFLKKKAAIWDVEDPNRTEIGKSLRQDFLQDYVKPKMVKLKLEEIGNQSKEEPQAPPNGRKKSMTPSKKGSIKPGVKKAPKIERGSFKMEVSEIVEPSYVPKLLPPLIEKFSIPLAEDVIPIVVKLEPIPTVAPLRLGPFREEIPMRAKTEEERAEEMAEEGEVIVHFSEEIAGKDLSKHSIESNFAQFDKQEADHTNEIAYINQKLAGDAALNEAYEERDRVVKELLKLQEIESAKAKRGVKEKNQSKKSIRRQSRKSVKRQSVSRRASSKK